MTDAFDPGYRNFHALSSVARSATVEDKPNDPRKSKEVTIMIFTAPGEIHHAAFARTLVDNCAKGEVSAKHLTLPHNDLMETIAELRKSGEIGDNTQIILDMHGGMVATRDQGKVHFMVGHPSLAVVQAVRNPLQGEDKPCSASIYITACEAGREKLIDELSALHDAQKAGVCFLLSGKDEVLDNTVYAAVMALCEQFVAAKRCNDPEPPKPHHILAQMGSYRGDSMTMIAPGSVVTIRGPELEKEFGPEGLQDAIARAAGSRAEAKRTGASVIGDANGLSMLDEALGSRKKLDEDSKDAEHQWKNVLDRKLNKGYEDLKGLRQTLESKPEFMEMVSREEWNKSHEYIARLMGLVSQREDPFAKAQLDYLYSMISGKKKHLDNLDDDHRLTALRPIVAYPAFEYLMEKGFLSKSDSSAISEIDKIRHVFIALSEDAELGFMKKIMTENNGWKNECSKDTWNESHTLIADMLEAAALQEDEDASPKESYLRDLLEGKTALLSGLEAEAMKIAATASSADLIGIVRKLPQPQDLLNDRSQVSLMDEGNISKLKPSRRFEVLEETFRSALKDPDVDRRAQKCRYLFSRLEPQIGLWIARASVEELFAILESSPDWRENLEKDDWNATHSLIFEAMHFANADPDAARRHDKSEAIFKLLADKKAAFQAAPDHESLLKVATEHEQTFRFLKEKGFFSGGGY